ncbi:hypothetical protein ACU8KH_06142 [Lachancea thermotolerans]
MYRVYKLIDSKQLPPLLYLVTDNLLIFLRRVLMSLFIYAPSNFPGHNGRVTLAR